MHVHLVFVTKYRRGVFTKEILDDMRDVFASVCTDFEAQLVEFDGADDHVHLLVNYPPKVSVSALVNSLKGVSTMRPSRFTVIMALGAASTTSRKRSSARLRSLISL
jgi:REP element-mobilizing transposase RayT